MWAVISKLMKISRRDFALITKRTLTRDSLSAWSKMLTKVFKINATHCEHCKGEMATVAAITNLSDVTRYLKHLGIEHEAQARATPRYQEKPFEFGSVQNRYETTATKYV